MTITYKIVSIVAVGLLYAVIAVPAAFADTDVEIRGNGSFSENEIEVERESSIEVEQENETDISNNVSISANTGGNSASGNTGGDVRVRSGNSSTSVLITNKSGCNSATIDNSCLCEEDLTVSVGSNGSFSENEAEVEETHELEVEQKNEAEFENNVEVSQYTGGNRANFNTRGLSRIRSGHSDIFADLWNKSGHNRFN